MVTGTTLPEVQKVNEEFGLDMSGTQPACCSPGSIQPAPNDVGDASLLHKEQQCTHSRMRAQVWCYDLGGTGKEGEIKPNELSDLTTLDTMGRHCDRGIHGSKQYSSQKSGR